MLIFAQRVVFLPIALISTRPACGSWDTVLTPMALSRALPRGRSKKARRVDSRPMVVGNGYKAFSGGYKPYGQVRPTID